MNNKVKGTKEKRFKRTIGSNIKIELKGKIRLLK